ncbi:MAG: hypothetical protein V7724_16620 [Sediminicola sp.]|tara:strand:- start:15660 stop:16571 length:912 start_codon:yes stop_codon:yes gene_type:complete
MNVADFTYLLQHPEKVVSPVQTRQLEDVLETYPYFQAARALHLKGLKNLNSFKFNNALKVTAAHTTDRDILFEFITSEDFLQNTIADSISGYGIPLKEKEIFAEEVEPTQSITTIQDNGDQDGPYPKNIREAEQILDPSLFSSKDPRDERPNREPSEKSDAQELEMGQPLPFTKKEKYSFMEWLQLTAPKALEEPSMAQKNLPMPRSEGEIKDKKKKFDLIDKFIQNNPKIVPKEKIEKVDIKESIKMDKKELMTETLAKVYLEQKKYKNAIQAYRILSLKYPEKSSFFADRIKAVEKLQKEN